jgi:transposase
MPPDVRDWLPEGHLAWFVLDAVAGMDLGGFYGVYRRDGVGRRAYDPAMVVALLLYAYARGVRSARKIERACEEDVAFKTIAMMETPDHATIARFVVRHEAALAELFGEVLRLCDEAGLVKPGVVAVDGTRMAGNASPEANREFAQIAREILAEAKATDEAEDEQFGQARGDELPVELRTPEGRREFFRKARQRLRGEETDRDSGEGEAARIEPELELDAEEIVGRGRQGRDAWLREGKRQLERHRWEAPDPVSRSREERLLLAAERLDEELSVERRANEAYEDYRAQGRMKDGRRFGKPPKPHEPPEIPEGKVNVTDPDSKHLKTTRTRGYVQGYNAQAVVDEGQIVLAAEITNSTVDWSQLDPMITATVAELAKAGVEARLEVALADSQYWNEEHIDEVIANKHVQVLIPPESGLRAQPRPGWIGGRYDWMRCVLKSVLGGELYRKRKHMIEPVFGHTRHNRQATRFHRRGRSAVRTEWRLLMATHNLTKLHRHQTVAIAV